jgi:hypothetical protein
LLPSCTETAHDEVAYAKRESPPRPASPAIGDKRVPSYASPHDRIRRLAGAPADLRFGDIPIAGDEASEVVSGALVGERPKRGCIGSRAFLHGAVPACIRRLARVRWPGGTGLAWPGLSEVSYALQRITGSMCCFRLCAVGDRDPAFSLPGVTRRST